MKRMLEGPTFRPETRDALLEVLDKDRGQLLADELFQDGYGLERLFGFAGNRGLAIRTIKAILANAAKRGASEKVRNWDFFRRAISEDKWTIIRSFFCGETTAWLAMPQ